MPRTSAQEFLVAGIYVLSEGIFTRGGGNCVAVLRWRNNEGKRAEHDAGDFKLDIFVEGEDEEVFVR